MPLFAATCSFLLALVLTGACAACAEAAAPEIGPPGVRVLHDLAYVPGGDPAQALDLYLPEQSPTTPLPLLIWIHGGGWAGGSKQGCYFAYLVGQGYAAASIEYRFSSKALFPAQIQDCQAAIRWLRANAKTYNLDPKRFGVGGDSAGGHLAALVGTSGGSGAFPAIGGSARRSDRVQAALDLYGPADFATVVEQATADPTKSVFNWNHDDPYSKLIGVDLGSDRAKEEAVSPVHYVSKKSPPFLILHGTTDSLVPFAQSVELSERLKRAKRPVFLQRFPGWGHGGGAFGSPEIRRLVKDFFDRYLLGAGPEVRLLPDASLTFHPNGQ